MATRADDAAQQPEGTEPLPAGQRSGEGCASILPYLLDSLKARPVAGGPAQASEAPAGQAESKPSR